LDENSKKDKLKVHVSAKLWGILNTFRQYIKWWEFRNSYTYIEIQKTGDKTLTISRLLGNSIVYVIMWKVNS